MCFSSMLWIKSAGERRDLVNNIKHSSEITKTDQFIQYMIVMLCQGSKRKQRFITHGFIHVGNKVRFFMIFYFLEHCLIARGKVWLVNHGSFINRGSSFKENRKEASVWQQYKWQQR